MSQQNPNPDHNLANFVGIYLTLVFIIVFALISRTSQQPMIPVVQAAADETAVAILPTAIPQVIASATPTPTVTVVPANTAVPSVIPTTMPTLPATHTPQAVMTADTAMHGHTAADYDPALAERGKTLFMLCAACHGADARGLPNLGKNLVESGFLHSLTDAELVEFIKTGRPMWDPLNTTGIDMPPKGGNPALTDDDILAIIAYIHSLVPTTEEPQAAQPVTEMTIDYDPALVTQGQQNFTLCAACHGADARGLPNLGKNLVESEFVHSLTDAELVEFIKTGRPMWDPLNTTGIDMPPKGGNPALADEDLLAIVAYLRSLSSSGG